MLSDKGSLWLWVAQLSTLMLAATNVLEANWGVALASLGPVLVVAQMGSLAAAALVYRRSLGPTLRAFDPIQLAFLAGLGQVAAVGVINGNPLRLLVLDLLGYVPVWAGLVLSRSSDAWRRVPKPVLACYVTGLALALANTANVVIDDRSLLREQSSYRLQTVLILVPYLGVALARSDRFVSGLLVSASIVQVALALLFQKRATAGRLLLLVAMWLVLSRLLKRRTYHAFAAMAVGVGVLAVLGRALNLDYAARATLDRVFGEGSAAAELSVGESNPRWYEARLLLGSMSKGQLLLGLGAGGFFRDSPLGIWDTAAYNMEGRVALHVGLAMPLMKGGLLFAALYYLPALALFLKRPGAASDLETCCKWALAAFLLMQLTEGGPSWSDSQTGLAYGLLAGQYLRGASRRFAVLPRQHAGS